MRAAVSLESTSGSFVRLFGVNIFQNQPPNPSNAINDVVQRASRVKRSRKTTHPSPPKRAKSSPPPPQPLPKAHRDLLLSMGATVDERNPVHIFTKTLFKSDVVNGQNRLTMSPKNLLAGFLTPEEEERIQQKDDKGKPAKMQVKVIDPTREVRTLNLSKWNWQNDDVRVGDQGARKGSWWYALNQGWRVVVEAGQLDQGDTIQVWSFRGVRGEPGFIIHKVEDDDHNNNSNSGVVLDGSSSGSSDQNNHGGASGSGGSASPVNCA